MGFFILFSAAACVIPLEADFRVPPSTLGPLFTNPDPAYTPEWGKNLPYNYAFVALCNDPRIPVAENLYPKCVFDVNNQTYKIDKLAAMECFNYSKLSTYIRSER